MAVRVRDRRPTRPGRRGGGSSIMAAIRSRRGQKTQLRRRRRRHRRRRRRRRRRASWNRVESVASVFMVFFFSFTEKRHHGRHGVRCRRCHVVQSSGTTRRPDEFDLPIYRVFGQSFSFQRNIIRYWIVFGNHFHRQLQHLIHSCLLYLVLPSFAGLKRLRGVLLALSAFYLVFFYRVSRVFLCCTAYDLVWPYFSMFNLMGLNK